MSRWWAYVGLLGSCIWFQYHSAYCVPTGAQAGTEYTPSG